MKYANTMALTGALIWLVGCTSPAKVAVLEPIGPTPAEGSQKSGDGRLQVYSARIQANIDANMAEWRCNNDFGRNAFMFEPTHTGYTIYNQGGMFLKHVPNSRNRGDGEPTLVSLPPGRYEIRAEAEDYAGRVEVRVPVVIRAGQTTAAHLTGDWNPGGHFTDDEVVRLPDGEIAGWLAKTGG